MELQKINVPGYLSQFTINPKIPFKIRDKFTSERQKGLKAHRVTLSYYITVITRNILIINWKKNQLIECASVHFRVPLYYNYTNGRKDKKI